MLVAEICAAIVLCLIVQGFSAASEIALVSADQAKVAAGRARGGRLALLAELLRNRDRLLALALTTSNLATVSAAAMLTGLLHSIRPALAYWAPFVLTPLALLVGEAIPKVFALKRSIDFARIVARPLFVLSSVLAPVLAVETALSRLLRRLIGVPPEFESVFLGREDLRLLLQRRVDVTAVAHPDAILPGERQMISRILRFTHGGARKVVVPLVRVAAVAEDSPISAAIATVRREGYSRLPVFRGRITDIVGVVHVFDLLEAPDLNRPVSDLMRPVSYFPESMPLDEVLVALQRTGEHMAVIVDEYGGAAGILTVEDLLEEIVGEIEDEYDSAERLARIVNRRTLKVAGGVSVAELNERFGLKLPESEGYATIGGLVVERLGHIPKPGEQLKAGDATITVTRSDARAVHEVMLHLGHALRAEHARRA